MEKDIQLKFNYSDYSLPVLLSLFRYDRNIPYERKEELLVFIVEKYFEDKKSVNIYDILNSGRGVVFDKVKRANFYLNILNREFKTAYDPMPVIYQEAFFKFLIGAMDFVEKTLKENQSSIEWHLSEIPALINYLSNIDKNNIKSPSLRQRINELVSNIKKEYDEVEQSKTNALQVTKTSIEKLEEIPYLKLQKSKLNKQGLADALKTFKLYDEKDKEYLISVIKKKNWKELFYEISSVDSFDFLRYHYEPLFNMWEILFRSLSQTKFVSEMSLNQWYEYFKVDNFNDLISAIKGIYMSYEGATERGFDYYLRAIIEHFTSSRHLRLEDKGSIETFYRSFYRDTYLETISYFNNEIDGDLLNALVNKKQLETEMTKIPVLEMVDGNLIMREYVHDISIYISDMDYYFELFERYKGVFFEYYGFTSPMAEIQFYDETDVELVEKSNVFIRFLDRLTFNCSDIVLLSKLDYNHLYSNTGVFRKSTRYSKDTLGNICCNSEHLNYFFRRVFCLDSKYLTDDFLREVWFEGHLKEFLKLVPLHTYSGYFMDTEEYCHFFFKRLKNELNFGKKEDVEKLFMLVLPYGTLGAFGKSILDKIRLECPNCYKILDYTLEGDFSKNIGIIYDCLRAYYGIEDKF